MFPVIEIARIDEVDSGNAIGIVQEFFEGRLGSCVHSFSPNASILLCVQPDLSLCRSRSRDEAYCERVLGRSSDGCRGQMSVKDFVDRTSGRCDLSPLRTSTRGSYTDAASQSSAVPLMATARGSASTIAYPVHTSSPSSRTTTSRRSGGAVARTSRSRSL